MKGPARQYRVVELVDPREPTIPRAVFACRQGESPWRAVWQHRHEIDSKLAAWFGGLSDNGVQPVERCLLGQGVALHEQEAVRLAKHHVKVIDKMAGGFAAFLLNDRGENVGRRGRPVCLIQDGKVIPFPSIVACARFIGVARQDIRIGRPHDGRRFFVTENRNVYTL